MGDLGKGLTPPHTYSKAAFQRCVGCLSGFSFLSGVQKQARDVAVVAMFHSLCMHVAKNPMVIATPAEFQGHSRAPPVDSSAHSRRGYCIPQFLFLGAVCEEQWLGKRDVCPGSLLPEAYHSM